VKIRNQEFTDDTVEIDGNRFEDCTFKKCRMVFRAREPVGFIGCTFTDVTWHFEDAAGMTTAFMRLLSDMAGDYGKGLIVNTFPVLREWLRPEILAKLSPPEEGTNG
jgi:hypothetical protein